MFHRSLIATAVLAGVATIGVTSTTSEAGGDDTYAGGAAIAFLPQEFVLGGANPIGVNYAFTGNPFTPLVNGDAVPLYDPVSTAPTVFAMNATSSFDESDGSYSVSLSVFTQDGSAFVNDSTPLVVQTADGPQDATDFVIDLGNGYQLPGFPVDGVDVNSLPGTVFVNVEYWFVRLDNSENREFGDTTGPFLTPAGFTFGWGYDLYLDEPDNPNNPAPPHCLSYLDCHPHPPPPHPCHQRPFPTPPAPLRPIQPRRPRPSSNTPTHPYMPALISHLSYLQFSLH